MIKYQTTQNIQDLEFKVIYSSRRSMGISILPNSSVIVRVPYLTSLKTINRLVLQKEGWIKKHRESFKEKGNNKLTRLYVTGEIHLIRGKEVVLKIEKSARPYIRYADSYIELGLEKKDDRDAVKRLLYKWYKTEAMVVFPELFRNILLKHEKQMFKPSGLIIRTMKRRWGSCSNKGIITLSTELIRLPDLYIEYVIIHELCHLRHHNHGVRYYNLLSALFPEWKTIRKEMRRYVQ
jgi:predicted metal-dependent hydrolase